jgi:hypothetical protein
MYTPSVVKMPEPACVKWSEEWMTARWRDDCGENIPKKKPVSHTQDENAGIPVYAMPHKNLATEGRLKFPECVQWRISLETTHHSLSAAWTLSKSGIRSTPQANYFTEQQAEMLQMLSLQFLYSDAFCFSLLVHSYSFFSILLDKTRTLHFMESATATNP